MEFRELQSIIENKWNITIQGYAIIRAFRYDRVDNGIANIAQHKLFLQQTQDILSID